MVHAQDQVRDSPARAAGAPGGRALVLSKHEAAGNDFLVLVDLDGQWDLGPQDARRLCDRRRGVGADGLLLARPGDPAADTQLSMVLYNADGSRAEMSGNGIRCLVQAAVMAGAVAPGRVRVSTDAGVRTVVLDGGPGSVEPVPSAARGLTSASVDMGPVHLGQEVASSLPGTRARRAEVGNPHLVVVGDMDLESLDLAAVHRDATTVLGFPVNVEVVRPTAGGGLSLRVFERGVGETLACGTGSCAAAAVARSFGVAGDVVVVSNPGGDLEVRLPVATATGGAGGAGGSVVLAGPVRRVAEVRMDPEGR